MDKEIKAEFEKRDLVLERHQNSLDELTGSFAALQEETKGELAKMLDSLSSQPTSPDTSSEPESAPDPEAARLHDEAVEEVARLSERVNYLEGPDYQTSVIQGFLRDLDADNFIEIGRKLGYLDVEEPSEADLHTLEEGEVVLGDRKIKISKEKPEDMTGWEFSETQGVYIKVE